jgi:Domain of unknown function (DUF4126)
MSTIDTLGIALGAAWTAGINLYATVAALGLLQRYELVRLPGGLEVLSNPWVIGVALFLYAVEFFADKVPYFDTAWDALHTFVRVPAGAVLALAATTELHPAVQVCAVLLGGGVALSTHGTKATARAAVNVSPEPFTNWGLSLAEDVVAVGAVVLAVLHPAVILIVVGLSLLVAAWLLPKIFRRLRRLVSGARDFLSRRAPRGGVRGHLAPKDTTPL